MFAPKGVLHAAIALCIGLFTGALVLVLGPAVAPASATGTACSFTLTSTTQTLNGNCSTHTTIQISKKTFNGNHHTITVTDGAGSAPFSGDVLLDSGTVPSVTVENVAIKGSYTQTCDPSGNPQAQGIEIDLASATINGVTISGMNTGNTCTVGYDGSYGIAIDGGESATHRYAVTIENSTLDGYVGVGIYVIGNVVATINHNNLAAYNGNSQTGATGIDIDYNSGGSITPRPLITNNHIIDLEAKSTQGCDGIDMFGSNYRQTGSGKVNTNTIQSSCPHSIYDVAGIFINEASNIIADDDTISGSLGDGALIYTSCSTHKFANNDGIDNSSITGAYNGVRVASYQNSNVPPTCGGQANLNGVIGNTMTDLDSHGNPAGNDGVWIFECSPTVLTSPTGCYTDETTVSGNTFNGYSTNVLDEGSNSIISDLARPSGHLMAPPTSVRPDHPGN